MVKHTQAILDHPAFESAGSMSADYTPRSEPESKKPESKKPESEKPESKKAESKDGKDSLDVDLSSFF